MVSVGSRPTTLITIHLNKELRPSLGSRPLVHPHFYAFTSVYTGKLPKKLGPQVEVNQRLMCVAVMRVALHQSSRHCTVGR